MGQYGSFIVQPSGGTTRAVEWNTPVLTIGRGLENDIVLTDGRASRDHARIEMIGGQIVIVDLGSSNGTLVNGIPITGSTPVGPGTIITIGHTVIEYRAADSQTFVEPLPGAGLAAAAFPAGAEGTPQDATVIEGQTPVGNEMFSELEGTMIEPVGPPREMTTAVGSGTPPSIGMPQYDDTQPAPGAYDDDSDYGRSERRPGWVWVLVGLVSLLVICLLGVGGAYALGEDPIALLFGDETPTEVADDPSTDEPTDVATEEASDTETPEGPGDPVSISPVPAGNVISVSPGCGNGLIESGEACESEAAVSALCSEGYQNTLSDLRTQWSSTLATSSNNTAEDPICDGRASVGAIQPTEAAFETCVMLASLPADRLPQSLAEFHPGNLDPYPYEAGNGNMGVADLGAGEIGIEFAPAYADQMSDADVRDCVLAISSQHLFAGLEKRQTGEGQVIWCESEVTPVPEWYMVRLDGLDDYIGEVEGTCSAYAAGDLTCGENADCHVDRCECIEREEEYVPACGNGILDEGEQCEGETDCPLGYFCADADQGIVACQCLTLCGNGACEGNQGESASSCPGDCPPVCGDGAITHNEVCDGDADCGEDGLYCNGCSSCEPQCGDGIIADGEVCETADDCGGEGFYCESCGACTTSCGDGICAAGEVCADDCFTPVPPGDDDDDGGVPCPPDGYCGDGICSCVEDASSCSIDCSGGEFTPEPLCGNGVCDNSESAVSCGSDCPAVCGDGFITHSESCENDNHCGGGDVCSGCVCVIS